MYKNGDLDWIKELFQKRIFIFGAGEIGKRVFHNVISEGLEVAGFIDNDVNKHKEEIGNTSIISLQDFVDNKKDDDFIIISSQYVADIKRQLMNQGIYSFVDYTQIDFSGNGEDFYDEYYFEWQLKMARIDSQIDVDFFQPYIKNTDVVCEFGCGGGLLLEKIQCSHRIGIDINPVARHHAETLGIMTLKSVDELEDGSVDVFISSHALEHVLRPYETLVEIKKKDEK